MASDPLLDSNSNPSIGCVNDNLTAGLTLGQYLSALEENPSNHVYYIFLICGGLHIPSEVPGYEFLHLWKYFLYISVFVFGAATVGVGIYNFSVGGVASLIFIASFVFQAIIVYPVVINTTKRMKLPIEKFQIEVLPEVLKICQYYILVTMALSFIYYIIIVFSTFTHHEYSSEDLHYPLWFRVSSLYTAFTPLAVSLLSMWGLFFILLDAKEMYLNIIELQDLANQDQLTMTLYNKVYHKYIELNRDSQELCDGIAIVAYISIILFIISCWVFAAEFQEYTAVFIAVEVSLQFRETFLILFALPSIAKTNERFDQFSSHMSVLEWGQNKQKMNGPISPKQEQYGGRLKGVSCTVADTMDIESLESEEARIVDRYNLMYMRIWAATVDRPLITYVLGRKIKKREMRAQLLTIFVVGLGSLASFAIGGIYRSV